MAYDSMISPVCFMVTLCPVVNNNRATNIKIILNRIRKKFPSMLFACAIESTTKDSKSKDLPLGSIHAHLFVIVEFEKDLNNSLIGIFDKMYKDGIVLHSMPFISNHNKKSGYNRYQSILSKKDIFLCRKHIRYLTKVGPQLKMAKEKIDKCFFISDSIKSYKMIDDIENSISDDYYKKIQGISKIF